MKIDLSRFMKEIKTLYYRIKYRKDLVRYHRVRDRVKVGLNLFKSRTLKTVVSHDNKMETIHISTNGNKAKLFLDHNKDGSCYIEKVIIEKDRGEIIFSKSNHIDEVAIKTYYRGISKNFIIQKDRVNIKNNNEMINIMDSESVIEGYRLEDASDTLESLLWALKILYKVFTDLRIENGV